MSDYIAREEAKTALGVEAEISTAAEAALEDAIDDISAADVVPMDDLKKWLWKVALNNSNNYLGDACAELVSRLDGLRRYVQDGGAKMDEEVTDNG